MPKAKSGRRPVTLTEEARRANRLLKGKVVRAVWRHRRGEVAIEFDDGTRLFVNESATGLELSIC